MAMCRGPLPVGCWMSPWIRHVPGLPFSTSLHTLSAPCRQRMSATYTRQPTKVLALTKSDTNTSYPCCSAMCGWDTPPAGGGNVISDASVAKMSGSLVVGTMYPFPEP